MATPPHDEQGVGSPGLQGISRVSPCLSSLLSPTGRGFEPLRRKPLPTEGDAEDHSADIDPALAEYMLRRHETLRRAKQKLRAINAMRGLGRRVVGSSKLTLPTRAAPALPDASVAQPIRSPPAPPRVRALAGRSPFRARVFSW